MLSEKNYDVFLVIHSSKEGNNAETWNGEYILKTGREQPAWSELFKEGMYVGIGACLVLFIIRQFP